MAEQPGLADRDDRGVLETCAERRSLQTQRLQHRLAQVGLVAHSGGPLERQRGERVAGIGVDPARARRSSARRRRVGGRDVRPGGRGVELHLAGRGDVGGQTAGVGQEISQRGGAARLRHIRSQRAIEVEHALVAGGEARGRDQRLGQRGEREAALVAAGAEGGQCRLALLPVGHLHGPHAAACDEVGGQLERIGGHGRTLSAPAMTAAAPSRS